MHKQKVTKLRLRKSQDDCDLFSKSDQDGVYNIATVWTINRGLVSERPAAHTQPKVTQVTPGLE